MARCSQKKSPVEATRALRLDRHAEQRPLTIGSVQSLILVNASGSDLSNIHLGNSGEQQYLASAKKGTGEKRGFVLDAEDSLVERIDSEVDTSITAKKSKVRDIKARSSSAPQRYRALAGLGAILIGGFVVWVGKDSTSTTMNVDAFGTKWSLVTAVPGVALAFIGMLILVLPSRKD